MMFSNMASGICKLQQLATQIPSKLKEHILNLRPHNINPQVPDMIIWSENINGVYTTKSGSAAPNSSWSSFLRVVSKHLVP